jgi:hypothetical protein
MTGQLEAGDQQNHVALGGLMPHEIEGLGDLIKQHLEKHGATLGLHYLAGEATSALDKELNKINLVEQLAKGWSLFKSVREAAHAPAGETAFVSLGEHHLTLKASPTLQLTIAGVRAPDLILSLDLAARFDSATLSVRDGALVGADPGDCEVTASVSSGSAQIGKPLELGKIDLKGPLHFSPGCPIPA